MSMGPRGSGLSAVDLAAAVAAHVANAADPHAAAGYQDASEVSATAAAVAAAAVATHVANASDPHSAAAYATASEVDAAIDAAALDQLVVDLNFVSMATADWKASPPATLDGVTVTLSQSGWTSYGIVNGTGLQLVTTATTGSAGIPFIFENLAQAKLGRAARPGDRWAVEFQLAAGQLPWAPANTQVYAFLGNAGASAALLTAGIGEILSGGSVGGILANATGPITSSESLVTDSFRSAGVRMLEQDLLQAFFSTSALDSDKPLDHIDTGVANNPSGAMYNFGATELLGRLAVNPKPPDVVAGVNVVRTTSGTATITIEKIRVWWLR